MNADAPVILYDGVCNLCNGTVRFVIRRDRAARFRFAALQSAAGRDLLARLGAAPPDLGSVLLIQDGHVYRKSEAALRIARRLDGAWPMLYALRAVPRSLRDGVYDFIGKRRYRWFGRTETCQVPGPEDRTRFLDRAQEHTDHA
jgi:predicted DCC family thiol-disulfide oxidoreductase YuxK